MGRGGSRVDGARVWAAVKRFILALGAAGVLALVRLIVRHRRTAHAFLANNPQVHPKNFRDTLLGELPTILKNYHRIYDLKLERAQSHGRNNALLTAFWDGRLIVSSSDPRVVKHILVDNVNNYIKSAVLIRVLKPLLGRGIFIANHGPHADDKGATWMYQRKTASKIFTRNVFQHIMADTFEANARKVCRLLEEVGGARPVDMQTIFFKYTMDSIGLIGFGVDLKTLDVEQTLGFTDAFDRAQKISAKRFLLPLAMTPLGPWLYESERELAACIRTMDHFCYKVIGERLRDAEVGNKRDILSNFINSMREAGDLPAQPEPDGAKVSDSVVFLRDVVMSFFIAGRDTTACTLSFTFLLLATHPEVQVKLFEELAQHMPDGAPPPTVTEFKQGFPYLHAVVQECLRLFPPVPTDGKEAVQRDVLPDGTVIEAGTAVNYEPCKSEEERRAGPVFQEQPHSIARTAQHSTRRDAPLTTACFDRSRRCHGPLGAHLGP